MRHELELLLNGSSSSPTSAKVTLDRTAYDSLLRLVQAQQKALVELHQYVDVMEAKLNLQRTVKSNLAANVAIVSDDDNMVFFGLGSTLLNEKAKVRLRNFFKSHDFKGVKITVNGYTDNKGTDQENKIVSQRRAESVAQFLKTEFNIGSGQITLNYLGYSNPRCTTNDEACNARNRRVEIKLGN